MTKPLGQWKLPQPTDLQEDNEWVPIPRVARTIPFGYELDPETGTCVPIDVVGGGDSSGPPPLGPFISPVTPPVTTPVEPTPPAPASSPTLVTPKQFNMGGATSGSNLDGAIGRLLSSMS